MQTIDDITLNIDNIEVNIDDIKMTKDDIKENAKAIEVNKDDIKMSKDDIKVNKDDIKVNKDDIKVNKDDIKMNKDDIKMNKDDIIVNKDDIKINKDDIIVNKDDIKVNKDDIIVNKDDIKVNKDDIKVNKDDIKVNKDDIKVNKDDIKMNKDDIKVNKDDIKVNKDDIKVNKDDIKVNKDDIKVNKDDIKMNKKNIKENRDVIHAMKKSLIPRLNAMEQQIYKDLAGQNKGQGDKTMTKKKPSPRNTSSRATKQITFLNIKNLIAHNNIDKVRELLQFHSEIVHIRDVDYQRTLLMLAALYTDSTTMIELLISHGSNVWAEDFYKSNVYHYAAAFGRQKILQVLCDHDVTNINNLTLTNDTPFYLAAWYCQIECVDVLLRQHGIDITIKSKTGKTAYDVAGKNIKKKIVRKLKTS
ncbi:uncharacterized protein PF3D7_0210200-like [Hydractinia symbiolongicarpus]|uniref:uncharacterized protein PF3D7_0210200-like n=1 Tax=Hydractinia symbiolongicarpus TaxID=13093 RepID=UPI0025511AE6|nr:uncharacterized protein PF3D7_0210200-like [Hydractinia symbiolongicarpus]